VEGLVSAPTAEALAQALAKVAADESLANRLGGAGLSAAASLSWPRVVERLVMV